MSTQIQRRRGTTAQHSSFTGALGETTVDTDKEVVVVHDGVQVGGYPQMRENGSNSALALGSAGTPSLKFTGDPNTGIYSPGADQLALATGGSGRLFISSAGRVGIGATASYGPLEVTGDGGITFSPSSNSTNSSLDLAARNGSNASAISRLSSISENPSDSSSAFTIATRNGTTGVIGERLRITSAGLVGIGVSSPSGRLHVIADANTSGAGLQTWGYDVNQPNYQLRLRTDVSAGVVKYNFNLLNQGTEYDSNLVLDRGKVGIGDTAPSEKLSVVGAIISTGGRGTSFGYKLPDCRIFNPSSGGIFAVDDYTTERLRIDGSGRLLVGTSSTSGVDALLQISSVGTGSRSKTEWFHWEANTGGPQITLSKSRGSSAGSFNVVSSGDELGGIYFRGANGTAFGYGAAITGEADGGWGVSDHPARLVFSTTADGASSPTERVRINNLGFLKASNTGSYAGASGAYHEFCSDQTGTDTLLLRNTVASNPYGISLTFTSSSPNNATNYFLYCQDSTAQRVTLRSNGGLANYSANNVNLSDRNVKKDIAPAAGTWDCLKEWEIVNFRYKDQPDDADLNMGVIAQQVAESCPEVIQVFQEAKEATDDQPAQEERIGVKEQQMMWMAIKALQEAQLRIETLEAANTELAARVSALEPG